MKTIPIARAGALSTILLLWCVSSLHAQSDFPIGAYHTYQNSQRDAGMRSLGGIDSVGINMWHAMERGLPLSNPPEIQYYPALLDSAATRGIPVFLHSWYFQQYTGGSEAISARYDVEDPWYFELGDYPTIRDDDSCLFFECAPGSNVVRAELSDPAEGRILAGKLNTSFGNYHMIRSDYDHEPGAEPSEVHAFRGKVRLKVDSTSPTDTEDVDLLKITLLGRLSNDGCTAEFWTPCLEKRYSFVIRSGDHPRDEYVQIDWSEIPFEIPNDSLMLKNIAGEDSLLVEMNRAVVNLQIEWLGQRSVSVDWVQLENEVASNLLHNRYNQELDNIINERRGGPGRDITHVVLGDEPRFNSWRIHRYMNDYFAKKGIKVLTAFAVGSTNERRLKRYEEYLSISNPHYFPVDFYPFRADTPSPDFPQGGNGIPPYGEASPESDFAYNQKIQADLVNTYFPRIPCAAKSAKQFNRDFWYMPQNLGIAENYSYQPEGRSVTFRPITANERSAEIFLALSYGAKGLFYFQYGSQYDTRENGEHVFAAVDNNYSHHSNFFDSSQGLYTGYKNSWNSIREINSRVHQIGPTLLHLSAEYSKAYGGNIQSLIDHDLGCDFDYSGPMYVLDIRENGTEVEDLNLSIFSDDTKYYDYFMLVNRQTFDNSTRTIKVQLDNELLDARAVENVENGVMYGIDEDGAFNITIDPGEGLLLRPVSCSVKYRLDEPSLGNDKRRISTSESDCRPKFVYVTAGSGGSGVIRPTIQTENRYRIYSKMGSVFALDQNHPNPFKTKTTISYRLEKESMVRLEIFNSIGQIVATMIEGQQAPGVHNVSFDGSDLPSGVYIYRIRAGDQEASRQMVILK